MRVNTRTKQLVSSRFTPSLTHARACNQSRERAPSGTRAHTGPVAPFVYSGSNPALAAWRVPAIAAAIIAPATRNTVGAPLPAATAPAAGGTTT